MLKWVLLSGLGVYNGKTLIEIHVQNPDYIEIEGYTHISQSVGRTIYMMDRMRSGQFKPLLTHSKKETEKIGGFFPSDQMVIAGRTGSGKSAKALIDLMDYCNIELNPFYANDLLILLDSYEMIDWRVIMRLISRKGEIEAKALMDYNKRLTEERFQMLKSIATTFSHLPIYIAKHPLTARQWVESKKQIQGKHPKKRIMNVFDHTRLGLKENESKEEELITNFMLGGMHLKRNFEMWNIFLSQLNRNIETAINRDKLGTHLPVASDIFGSDAVFQTADIVIALHRPGSYGLEYFEDIPTGYQKSNPDSEDNLLIECILKQREGWIGNILMKHNIKYNHIEDYVLDSQPQQKQLNSDFL